MYSVAILARNHLIQSSQISRNKKAQLYCSTAPNYLRHKNTSVKLTNHKRLYRKVC